MTILAFVFAFDCLATVMVGTWKAGPPVAWRRTPVCEVQWAGSFQPDLISWCAFLGPHRCTLRIDDPVQ